MAVNVPVGFGQLTIRWRRTLATRDAVVVIGYDPPSIDPGAHAFAIHTILTAVNRPCHSAQMGTDYAYTGVRCTEMTDTGPLSVDFPGLVQGAAAIALPPPQVSVLFRKATLAGGRRNRGRMFVPPIFPAESTIDSAGVIANAQVTTLNTNWQGVRTDMNTAGLEWVIFHSQVPFTPTVVTGLFADSLIATQRRRLRK